MLQLTKIRRFQTYIYNNNNNNNNNNNVDGDDDGHKLRNMLLDQAIDLVMCVSIFEMLQ